MKDVDCRKCVHCDTTSSRGVAGECWCSALKYFVPKVFVHAKGCLSYREIPTPKLNPCPICGTPDPIYLPGSVTYECRNAACQFRAGGQKEASDAWNGIQKRVPEGWAFVRRGAPFAFQVTEMTILDQQSLPIGYSAVHVGGVKKYVVADICFKCANKQECYDRSGKCVNFRPSEDCKQEGKRKKLERLKKQVEKLEKDLRDDRIGHHAKKS